MIKDINYTLLIILVILVIFCVSFYVYNGVNVSNIIKYDNFNNVVDSNTMLLELMNVAKENATKKLKEKFNINTELLLEADANNYYKSINETQSWLDNSYNGDIAKISSYLKTTKDLRNSNKEELLNLLTNIYIINYINYINKQNSESYKMYLKYNNPNKNKYYKQYMK